MKSPQSSHLLPGCLWCPQEDQDALAAQASSCLPATLSITCPTARTGSWCWWFRRFLRIFSANSLLGSGPGFYLSSRSPRLSLALILMRPAWMGSPHAVLVDHLNLCLQQRTFHVPGRTPRFPQHLHQYLDSSAKLEAGLSLKALVGQVLGVAPNRALGVLRGPWSKHLWLWCCSACRSTSGSGRTAKPLPEPCTYHALHWLPDRHLELAVTPLAHHGGPPGSRYQYGASGPRTTGNQGAPNNSQKKSPGTARQCIRFHVQANRPVLQPIRDGSQSSSQAPNHLMPLLHTAKGANSKAAEGRRPTEPVPLSWGQDEPLRGRLLAQTAGPSAQACSDCSRTSQEAAMAAKCCVWLWVKNRYSKWNPGK